MATAPVFPSLRRELDRIFDMMRAPEFFAAPGVAPFPAVNLWTDRDNVFVEAEVAGLRLEDLEISMQGSELTIRGKRPTIGDPNAAYLRRERGSGEFVRFLTLPFEVDADKVEATLRHGVLTLRMPKAERAKARRIQVRSE
ncbi:MAG: Hsp20/alpha crystallin family protein [Planctomycetota bacterium]